MYRLSLEIHLGWHSFWDCFEPAIHLNPCLTGSFLQAQLSDEAARVVAGLPLTNANYQHSISLLKDKYRQTHKLANTHVQALIDLPNPVNILTSLQLFHDTVESHICFLRSLGKTLVEFEMLLIPIMLGKLSVETKKNIARVHECSQWTMQQLQVSLLREIRIFETSQHTGILWSYQHLTSTASFHTATDRKSRYGRKE